MKPKPNLILLHGWAMGRAIFELPEMGLSQQFHLHTPALPGYPLSEWSSMAPFDEQIELMAADLPRGHLLGWSLGGLYALNLYHRFPQQFSGLTLVCFNPCFVSRPDWNCGVEALVFDNFADDLNRGWQPMIRRFLALQLLGQKNARTLAKSLVQSLSVDGVPDVSVLQEGLGLLKNTDSRDLLFSMSRPVQMIFTDQDPLIPSACASQIGQIAPAIQVECIAGAAHLPFLSHADQFGELLGASINPGQ